MGANFLNINKIRNSDDLILGNVNLECTKPACFYNSSDVLQFIFYVAYEQAHLFERGAATESWREEWGEEK